MVAGLSQSQQQHQSSNVILLLTTHQLFETVLSPSRQSVVESALFGRELSYNGLDVSRNDLERRLLCTILGFAAEGQRSVLLQHILGSALHESLQEDL